MAGYDGDRLVLRVRQKVGGLGDRAFDRAALLVKALQLGRDATRFLFLFGDQEADAQVRLADSSPCVDART